MYERTNIKFSGLQACLYVRYNCTYDLRNMNYIAGLLPLCYHMYVRMIVCLINTAKRRFQNVCYNIGTYVGEYQLHSGLLVDKRAKTIWYEVVLNGKLMYLYLGSNLSKKWVQWKDYHFLLCFIIIIITIPQQVLEREGEVRIYLLPNFC